MLVRRNSKLLSNKVQITGVFWGNYLVAFYEIDYVFSAHDLFSGVLIINRAINKHVLPP